MGFEGDIEKDPLLSKNVVDSVNEWSTDYGDDERFRETVKDFNLSIRFKFVFIAACIVAIVLIAGYAVTWGAVDISMREVYEIIWSHLTFDSTTSSHNYIVWELRMPRIVCGIVGGIGLAICGVIMQSVLKNPLADPYTTGVSSGASFGATLAIATGLVGLIGTQSSVALAFLFSLVPTVVIAVMSKFSNTSPTTMIMAGIGIMYIFNALTTVLMLWSNPNDLSRIFYWQTGSLSLVNWDSVPLMLAITAAGFVISMLLSGKLNVLATGDDSAKALGINTDRLRLVSLLLTGLISASIVSYTGLIGFVGLVTPHIVRMFIGADNRYLIPASAIFGAALMLAADLLGRIVVYPSVLPVGVIMSFIGGPVFLWLIIRKNGSAW